MIECSKANVASWDLRTNDPITSYYSSSQSRELSLNRVTSYTYTMNEMVVAIVYFEEEIGITFYTFNLLSKEYTFIRKRWKAMNVVSVWIHGEHLRVATIKPGFITVWETGFSEDATLAKVESFPAPHGIEPIREILFLPALARLAFSIKTAVQIWDAQSSKCLLNVVGEGMGMISFSLDGQFFSCITGGLELCVWKDTPTGYTLHQKVVWDIRGQLLSPNGESIFVYNNKKIHLLSTRDATYPTPNVYTHFVDWTHFIMEFSPDQTLAAVAKREDNTVTVLDINSRNPQLIINAGTQVYGLRMTGSTIIVVGMGKVITWNLPTVDYVTAAYANTSDSAQTTVFDYSGYYSNTVISPDLKHIAIFSTFTLSIYNMSTGKHLTSLKGEFDSTLYFSPDACELWSVSKYSTHGWKLIEDSGCDAIQLEYLKPTALPLGIFPWQSSQGYKVMCDGWILNSNQKPLLWLPHDWRSDKKYRIWGGQLLGLVHGGLQQPVILEFPK